MNTIIDPTFSTIAIVSSVVGSLLTIVTMTTIAFIQRTNKSLSCRVTTDRLVSIEGSEGYEDKVRVLYDDVDIRNLYRVEIGISNSGNRPILPADFVEPIRLTLEEPAKVLTATVLRQHPIGIGAKVDYTDHEITVPALLMNPKDSFSIRTHVGDLEVEPAITGRIVGVREIMKKPSRVGIWIKFMAVLATFAAIVGGAWTLLDASLWAFVFSYTGFALMVLALGSWFWSSRLRESNLDT